MQLNELIQMSRKYGADKNYVLAGGGNTSYKENGVMAVKASGSSLGTIDEKGFVLMDIPSLRNMLGKSYPESDDEREAAAVKDMMASKLPGQEDKRPSVECILHALFNNAYVLHLHPALVNGMTCGVKGAEIAEEIFGDSAVWIPLTKPGFILSRECGKVFDEYETRHGKAPDTVFLQNHGLFVSADTVKEIDAKMKSIMKTLATYIKREPDIRMIGIAKPVKIGSDRDYVYGVSNRELLIFAQSLYAMQPITKPFTPDHIVYCKATPLYIEDVEEFNKTHRVFIEKHGYEPRIVVIKDLGAFGLGDNEKTASTALQVFMDGIRIAVYSESFGGPRGLDDDFTDFILNWEIESYRAKKSLSLT